MGLYSLQKKIIVSDRFLHLSLELEMLLRSQTVSLHCRDLPHLVKPGGETLQVWRRVVELLVRVDQVLTLELLRSQLTKTQPYHHCKPLNVGPDLVRD